MTARAGPAVKSIKFHSDRGGDAEIYGWIHDQIRERQEFGETEPCHEPDDYILAGPYADTALPVVLAIVTSSWADIERIAAAALNADCLTYGEVRRLTAGRSTLPDDISRWQAIAERESPVNQHHT